MTNIGVNYYTNAGLSGKGKAQATNFPRTLKAQMQENLTSHRERDIERGGQKVAREIYKYFTLEDYCAKYDDAMHGRPIV